MTYRGHTAAITSVLASSALQLVFSASLDSTIRIWKLPSPDRDPYGSYDPSLSVQKLVGHSEAIWDLCLLPNQSQSGTPHRLASASADGSVKIWTSEGGRPWSLLASVNDFGKGVVPTCLGVYHSDYTKLLIGLSDGRVQVYNVEKQVKEIVFRRQSLLSTEWNQADQLADVDSRVNAVLSHPIMPIIATAHEDGHIRIYNIPTDNPTTETIRPKETYFAHPSPITSLSLSPASPTEMISASTTCVMRVWDLVKGVSVQDIESHRAKGGEGITDVEGHPDLPIMASAGADGVVRLWSAA
jgi:striatin 1/3/4